MGHTWWNWNHFLSVVMGFRMLGTHNIQYNTIQWSSKMCVHSGIYDQGYCWPNYEVEHQLGHEIHHWLYPVLVWPSLHSVIVTWGPATTITPAAVAVPWDLMWPKGDFLNVLCSFSYTYYSSCSHTTEINVKMLMSEVWLWWIKDLILTGFAENRKPLLLHFYLFYAEAFNINGIVN